MKDSRRNAHRREVQLAAHLSHRDGAAACVITSLSRGGAFVTFDHAPRRSISELVQLAFDVPGPVAIRLETPAMITWTRPGGMGVRFDGLRPIQMWALGLYLDAPIEAPAPPRRIARGSCPGVPLP